MSALEYFKDVEVGGSVGPILVRCSDDLRQLAVLADGELGTIGDQLLREALVVLTNAFKEINKKEKKTDDLTWEEFLPVSKKLCLFGLANVMLKVY